MLSEAYLEPSRTSKMEVSMNATRDAQYRETLNNFTVLGSHFQAFRGQRKLHLLILIHFKTLFLTFFDHTLPFKRQSRKMVKHTQTNRRQFADDLFECV